MFPEIPIPLGLRQRRGAGRGRWTRHGTALCLLLTTACVPLVDQFRSDSSPRHVFAVGFENLSERYIEPVDTGDMVLAGLAGLAEFDDGVSFSRSGSTVQIRVGERIAQEREVPHENDAYGWGWLAAEIIEDARKLSPRLRATGNDELYVSMFRGALSGFDRYSRYTTPSDARNSRAAREGFGGLGITIELRDGVTFITKVHGRTPAARAGLKVDDRIVGVDGESIVGLAQRQVIDRLRGQVDEPIQITIERASLAAPMEITLVRAHILVPTVTVRRDGGVLKIKISGFNQGTTRDVRRALEQATRDPGAGLAGIILDLRGNPGGLLDQAVAVADLFLGDGRIISTKGRHSESNQIFDAADGEYLAGVPMAILINGKSASAAEILAVALRDRGRAAVLGTTSYGKGTVQTIIRLPNSGEMILTWARLHAPSGQTLHQQGIVPVLCTSGDDQHIEFLLDRLRSQGAAAALSPGRGTTAATNPHFSVDGRDACPPSPALRPADIEAARLLLANPATYARSLLRSDESIARR
jgi:carboxyl-terminal processing protease